MWGTIMAVNSFVVWPASVIFLIYATGYSIVHVQWKLFVIGLVFFAITTIAQFVLGAIAE